MNSEYVFSVGQHYGFWYGQAEEIVYSEDTKAPMLSQLLWDMKPVWYTGLLLEFARANPTDRLGFFSSLSLKYGIPGNSGIMEDRDWMSIENEELTHFSSHDNTTKEAFLLDIAMGYSFPLRGILVLKTFLNLSYSRFSFSGTDGYGKYARENPAYSGKYYPIDDDPNTNPYSGKVINYAQEWLNAAPGISAGVYFLNYFFAELSFQISPLIVCIDLDEHLTTKVQYRDYMRGGMLIEPQLLVAFNIKEWLALSIECSWRHISGTKGDTYQRAMPTAGSGAGNYALIGQAGADLSIVDTGFHCTIRL